MRREGRGKRERREERGERREERFEVPQDLTIQMIAATSGDPIRTCARKHRDNRIKTNTKEIRL